LRHDLAVIRRATSQDERALRRLDREGWSWAHSPAPPRPGRFDITGVLVYELDFEVAGYIQTGPLSPLESAKHVRQVRGLLVDARLRGRGIGRALVEAAIEQAELDGIRKLTLRVLGHNAEARALYEACGFEEEGRLRDLFLLEGTYVDDVLMSITTGGSSAST
jgi:RimJ/RimL family protein N-acetyltransferase